MRQLTNIQYAYNQKYVQLVIIQKKIGHISFDSNIWSSKLYRILQPDGKIQNMGFANQIYD